jgi:uncharacterized membrane protein
MARFWKLILFGLVVAVFAHVATTMMLPSAIMSIALKRIAQTAGGTNQLFHAQRVTPQNQTIVRPSPDLAYSTCALDLTKGPVRVFIGKGTDYASAAFYSANTDNVTTLSDKKIGPDGANLIVVTPGQNADAIAGERIITLPSNKGLMLVRRLAPSASDFERVTRERSGDRCGAASALQK